MFRVGLSYLKAPFGIGFLYLFALALPIEWIVYLFTPFLNALSRGFQFYEPLTLSQNVNVNFQEYAVTVSDHYELSWYHIVSGFLGVWICSLFSKAYLAYTVHNSFTKSKELFRLPRHLLPTLNTKNQILTYLLITFKLIFFPIALGFVFLFFWIVFGAVCLSLGFIANLTYETVFAFLISDGLIFMCLFGVFYIFACLFYFLSDFQIKSVFNLKRNFTFIRTHWLKMFISIGIMAGVLFLMSVIGFIIDRILLLTVSDVSILIRLLFQTIYLVYIRLLLSVIFGKCLYWMESPKRPHSVTALAHND